MILAGDDDDGGEFHGGMMGGSGYAGMMGAMGRGDSDAMLERMREVLGEDGFKRMQEHFAEHRRGGAMSGAADVDEMMHRMMDGMMQELPMDRGGMMPGRRSGGGTPTPAASPTR
jgi:hypothetical protein